MKSLIHYDEFGKNMGFPSMEDFFQNKPYHGMKKVIDYLKNGQITYVTAMKNVDFYSGKTFSGFLCGMTDGQYSWNNALPYYIENYNLKLDDDFIEYVLNK